MKKIAAVLTVLLLISCASDYYEEDTLPVRNELTEWVDYNRDGILQDDELNDLYMTTMFSLRGEHRSESPVDQFIDRDGDGFITEEEIDIFAHSVFILPIFDLWERIPHIAWLVDRNEDGFFDEEEVARIQAFMFEDDSHVLVPGPADDEMAWTFDKNYDDYIDQHEIDEARAFFFLNFIVFAPSERERNPVLTFLDELTDLNNDGFLDKGEIEIRMSSLEGPHPVENPFDERLDFNRNGHIEEFEIHEAVESDRQEVRTTGSLPVFTPVDAILDLNRDGRVSEEEIVEILDSFMQGAGPVGEHRLFSDFFDVEQDGQITESDLYIFREMVFRPHPVFPDSDFDRSLDGDEDGFVSPEEIGIAAGFSPDNPVMSFDERLERLSWSQPAGPSPEQEEKPEQKQEEAVAETTEESRVNIRSQDGRSAAAIKKLEQITGKSLAVVNLNIVTENVTEETAAGIILFVENAFVNLGYASVMDRANLESTLAEQNFALSSVVDEATAVEAGKIANLDFIVVGTISFVGNKYYLNVKCLNVRTNEIFGSSIAEAENQSEFYEMCNVAVGKFFQVSFF